MYVSQRPMRRRRGLRGFRLGDSAIDFSGSVSLPNAPIGPPLPSGAMSTTQASPSDLAWLYGNSGGNMASGWFNSPSTDVGLTASPLNPIIAANQQPGMPGYSGPGPSSSFSWTDFLFGTGPGSPFAGPPFANRPGGDSGSSLGSTLLAGGSGLVIGVAVVGVLALLAILKK